MKRQILFFILTSLGYPAFASCIFENMILANLGKHLQVSEPISTPYPEELFKAYKKQIGAFSKRSCRNAVVSVHIKDEKTAQMYTAVYTNEDDCDGGNSYGVVVSGDLPDPARAVAVIQDTFLYCLAGDTASRH